jgi:GNAT superfamily N-acetyltransferase
MIYRFATLEDVTALAALNQALIRDEGHRNWMTAAELELRMADWLGGEYQAVLFEESGQTAGYALFRRDPDYIYLRQFFVSPEYRRRGVGRAALDWLREHAWAEQYRVRVEVLVGNAAGVAFWRAAGFRDYCVTLELESHNVMVEAIGRDDERGV